MEATVFASACTRSKLAYIIDTLAVPQCERVGGLFRDVSAWSHVTRAHAHTRTHTHSCAHSHSWTHAHARTHTHAHTHTLICTYTQTPAYTHMHTRT